MNTLALIVRTDMLRLLRAHWLLPLLAAFAALCACAAWNGSVWSAQRQAAVATVFENEREIHATRRMQIAEQLTPENKAYYGGAIYASAMALRATLPPHPMAPLTAGQADGYPFAANISPYVASHTIYDDYLSGLDNPAVLAAGRVDMAFVLVWVLPLLLLAGSYELWAGERERGTAAWLLAQPVPLHRYIAGKLLARAFLLLAPMLALVLASLWWAGARDPGGLALSAALAGLYGLFWLTLAAAVNLAARRASEAALACVLGWLLAVVALPALALATVDLLAPAPAQAARVNALRAEAMAARAAARALAAAAPVQAQPTRNIPDSLRRRRAEVERGEVAIHAVSVDYRAQEARRQLWMERMRFASPAIALQDALERIAGNDAARALRFQDQSYAFLLDVRALAGRYLDADRLLGVADYDAGLPRFAFAEDTPAGRAAALGIDALAILLAAAVTTCFARRPARHDSPID